MKQWQKNTLIALITLLIVCTFVLGFCIGEMRTNGDVVKLHEIAQEENVPIYYVSKEAMQLWKIKGDFDNVPIGVYCNNTVYIDMQYRNRASLLAHELGHYFAILYENDSSEERADEIGEELLK